MQQCFSEREEISSLSALNCQTTISRMRSQSLFSDLQSLFLQFYDPAVDSKPEKLRAEFTPDKEGSLSWYKSYQGELSSSFTDVGQSRFGCLRESIRWWGPKTVTDCGWHSFICSHSWTGTCRLPLNIVKIHFLPTEWSKTVSVVLTFFLDSKRFSFYVENSVNF